MLAKKKKKDVEENQMDILDLEKKKKKNFSDLTQQHNGGDTEEKW